MIWELLACQISASRYYMDFCCRYLACLQQTVLKVAVDLLQIYHEILKVTTLATFGNSSLWGLRLLGSKECYIKLVPLHSFYEIWNWNYCCCHKGGLLLSTQKASKITQMVCKWRLLIFLGNFAIFVNMQILCHNCFIRCSNSPKPFWGFWGELH